MPVGKYNFEKSYYNIKICPKNMLSHKKKKIITMHHILMKLLNVNAHFSKMFLHKGWWCLPQITTKLICGSLQTILSYPYKDYDTHHRLPLTQILIRIYGIYQISPLRPMYPQTYSANPFFSISCIYKELPSFSIKFIR